MIYFRFRESWLMMDKFFVDIQVRWSDFDPNYHVRHTSYYEWGTLVRVQFFEMLGMPLEKMISAGFGPVILREECLFKKEVKHGDRIVVGLEIIKARKDFSRWTIQHPIMKNGDVQAALVTIDGGFIDHQTRKLTIPSREAIEAFDQMPKNPDFTWVE
jgi:acyl-CoA thioester hydrolase